MTGVLAGRLIPVIGVLASRLHQQNVTSLNLNLAATLLSLDRLDR